VKPLQPGTQIENSGVPEFSSSALRADGKEARALMRTCRCSGRSRFPVLMVLVLAASFATAAPGWSPLPLLWPLYVAYGAAGL